MRLESKQTKDRRIEKTKRFLHEALGSLIREKPYDEIAVQEILDRADVGRSTFYMHFRGKDELLVSAIREVLGPIRGTREAGPAGGLGGRITSFSLGVFEHIDQHRRTAAAMMGAGAWAVVHEHLRRVLAEQIAGDVKKHLRGRQRRPSDGAAGQIPPELLAQYVAATFILVLNWWIESRNRLEATEVDALFQALVEPALGRVLGS